LQFAALGPEARLVMMFCCEVEKCLECIIEKDTIGISLGYSNVKWNRFVKWILIESVGIGIRIPVSNTLATQIQIRRLIPQAKENLIGLCFFGTIHIITTKVDILFPMHRRKVCIQYFLLRAPERDKEVILLDKTGYRIGLDFIVCL